MSLSHHESYSDFFSQVKQTIQESKVKAIIAVNQELVLLYRNIWKLILTLQEKEKRGSNVIGQLSQDLKKAFPDMKGFSPRNLASMKLFALTYKDFEILQPLAAKLSWTHNVILLDRCKNNKERLRYAQKTIDKWRSVRVLDYHIETWDYQRSGKAISNFSDKLPSPQSDLAQQSFKDPYVLDFLGLQDDFIEKEMEDAIISHITKFLLELGKWYAFVGRQYHLEIGGDDFYIDLLFYNLDLRCYVIIELKNTKFKPEYAGKMNFYISVVDDTLKKASDNPTIGLILCKSKNDVTAEYALQGNTKPVWISEFDLKEALPKNYPSQLPTIEELEHELKEIPEIPERKKKKFKSKYSL